MTHIHSLIGEWQLMSQRIIVGNEIVSRCSLFSFVLRLLVSYLSGSALAHCYGECEVHAGNLATMLTLDLLVIYSERSGSAVVQRGPKL